MPDLGTTMTVIDACGMADVPPVLISDPGVGKSNLVRALARAKGVPCETVLGSIRDRSEIGGLPLAREDSYILVPGKWARNLEQAGEGFVFLDELTTCPPDVQGAMLAVVLDRVVGDVVLPPAVKIVAGANPPGSAAGGYELEPPMANRLCHIPFQPTTDEWIDGMTNGWSAPPPSRAVVASEVAAATARASVVGYIQANPGQLDGFARAEQKSGPWASRRTWDMLSRTLAYVRADDTAAVQALTFGLVGEGAGVGFLEWRAKGDLPAPDTVVADPASFDWAGSRPDRVWTVLTAVTTWAVSRGTIEAWRQAWKPVVAAEQAGLVDVAGAAARTLFRSRPLNAGIPKEARVFRHALKEAGLLEGAAA